MARLMRVQDPDFIYHVTNRTQEAKFLFVPDDEFTPIAHATLRQAIRIYDVHFYAGVLMANHPHFLLRAPLMNLHLFMEYFQGKLARQTNVLRGRFDAAVFPERYSAEPILDIESLLRLLAYVYCNPVNANLVEHPHEYPGITTYRQQTGLEDPFALPLSTLPMWEHLDAEAVALLLRELVAPTVARCARERWWPVKGAERVKKVRWSKRPRRPKRGSKAVCHGATKLVRAHYANFLDNSQTRYQAALRAMRRGETGVAFPYGMIPPGCRECSTAEPHRRAPEHLRLALHRLEES